MWRDGLAKQDSDRRKQLAMVLNAVSLGPRIAQSPSPLWLLLGAELTIRISKTSAPE
ncbi:hypothetical protein SAMN06295998_10511 [Primorskyibacter flagellatus]|uniref:Uncharacterized protein n=1 Tax=Primorskyibacter flagellatus TaxID=1387277 RepID=A0A1W2BVQ5_9RHOB|nr:hypothetical protein SAMN06295998_10511 [Primorskyibacter flagellatus]